MISLKDFLAFDFVNDVKPLYPILSPEKITIQYISILEPPVEQFVREGEIILSSALSVRDNKKELFNFINEIYLSKAPAIILAFPNDTYRQLDEIKDYFCQINFPILTLPWNHLFSDIVEHTLKEIWDKDKDRQSLMESLQKELLNTYLSGASFNEAANIIYKYLGCDIFIIDTNENIKGSNITYASRDISYDTLSDNYYRMPIMSGDKFYGYIVFQTKDIASQNDTQVLEQYIITPLTLWFDKEWSITASKMKSKKDFVWKLTHNDFLSSEEIFSKADVLGFNSKCNYICFVGAITSKANIKNGNWNINSDAPFSIHFTSNIIQEQIVLAAQELGLSVMTTIHKRTIIIYLEKSDNDLSIDHANSYLDKLDAYVDRILPNIAFIWGFDNQSLPMDMLSKNYANAKEALKISMQSGSHTLRNCYQLSIKQKIIYSLLTDEEIIKLAEYALKNIIEYDNCKSADLMQTLECYCMANYNISETARLLHLHRQSLLYRLSKIESLCNLSLKKHDDLFVIELCILLHKSALNRS